MARWILGNGSETVEAERAEIRSKIDAWWSAFVENAPAISATFRQKAKFDLVGFIRGSLNAISGELCWEFGPGVTKGGHRLVITPESTRELRPLVTEILARAPDMPGWEFYGHRLRDPVQMVPPTVECRLGIRLGNAPTVVVSRGRQGLVDLEFELDQTVPTEKLGSAGFLISETVLGEASLDLRVGVIDANHVKRSLFGKAKPQGISLGELAHAFDAEVERWTAELPKQPWFEIRPSANENAIWKQYGRNQSGKAPPNRADLMVGTIASDDLLQAIPSPVLRSERLSTFGEQFIYVQAEASYVPREERTNHRYRLQDALDETLASQKLGAVVGGAAGTQYDYIDLAVMDLPKAANLIAETLRELRVPRPSWIRCHDAELVSEWQGIWDDVEPPPPIVWE